MKKWVGEFWDWLTGVRQCVWCARVVRDTPMPALSTHIVEVQCPECEEKLYRARALKVKVCEGCEGVVVRTNAFCPACRGYRFSEDPERIVGRLRANHHIKKPEVPCLTPDFGVHPSTRI